MKIQRVFVISLFVVAVSSMSFATIINPGSASVDLSMSSDAGCGLVRGLPTHIPGRTTQPFELLGKRHRAVQLAEPQSHDFGRSGCDVDCQHEEGQDYFQEHRLDGKQQRDDRFGGR